MTATLFDVSRRCGVSSATVSRVVNGSPLVQEHTRQRVLRAIRDLRYRPSHAARTLARQRTDTLGVIFPEIDSGFFSEVLRGIDQVAAEHHFHLMTAFSHGLKDEEELVMRFVQERRVDTLIILNLLLPNPVVRRAAQAGLPLVLIDRPVSGANLTSVSMDNFGGAQAAYLHLLQQGYRRIAIITGPKGSYDADQRLLGCRQVAGVWGMPIPRTLVWRGDFSEESGEAAVRRELDAGRELPDAIFACNDMMAIGAMTALRERSIRVPEDVALVGFDDIGPARHLGLSTVRSPMQDMGKAAARAAIDRVLNTDKPARRQSVLPTRLMVRQSSPPRAGRPAAS
jgi:LacI family transcriptional regulator